MNDKDLLDLYKQSYYFELQRKEELNRSLSIPMGLVTVLAGAILFYLRNLPNGPLDALGGVFLLLLGVTVLAAFVAIGYIARAWTGHEYVYLWTPKEIEEQRAKLQRYFEQYPDAPPGAEKALADLLRTRFAECADLNTRTNDRKAFLRYNGNRYIIAATVAIMVGAVPFFMLQRQGRIGAVSVPQGATHEHNHDAGTPGRSKADEPTPIGSPSPSPSATPVPAPTGTPTATPAD